MTMPEFSRRIRLDEIGTTPRRHDVAAEPAERALLAERFGLKSLDRLAAQISVSREAAGIRARGEVEATLSQVCVVSGQPIPVSMKEPLDVLFSVAASSSGADEELELSSADCDVVPLDGEFVDIGECAAETMSLALDPYPRLSDEELAEYRRVLKSEEEAEAEAKAGKTAANPFSVLKK